MCGLWDVCHLAFCPTQHACDYDKLMLQVMFYHRLQLIFNIWEANISTQDTVPQCYCISIFSKMPEQPRFHQLCTNGHMAVQYDHRGASQQVAQIRSVIGDPPENMFPNIQWPEHPPAGNGLATSELPVERCSLCGMQKLVGQILQWNAAKRPSANQVAAQVQLQFQKFQAMCDGDNVMPLQDSPAGNQSEAITPLSVDQHNMYKIYASEPSYQHKAPAPSPDLSSAQRATMALELPAQGPMHDKTLTNPAIGGQLMGTPERVVANTTASTTASVATNAAPASDGQIGGSAPKPASSNDAGPAGIAKPPPSQPGSHHGPTVAKADKHGTAQPAEENFSEAPVQACPVVQRGTPVLDLMSAIPRPPENNIAMCGLGPSAGASQCQLVLQDAPIPTTSTSMVPVGEAKDQVRCQKQLHEIQIMKVEAGPSQQEPKAGQSVQCVSCRFLAARSHQHTPINDDDIPNAMDNSTLCKKCTVLQFPTTLGVLYEFGVSVASMEDMTMSDIHALHLWRQHVPHGISLDIPTIVCLAWLKNPQAIQRFTELQQQANNWEPDASTMADWLWESASNRTSWDPSIQKALESGRPTGAKNAIRCLGVGVKYERGRYERRNPVAPDGSEERPWILEILIQLLRGIEFESFNCAQNVLRNSKKLHKAMLQMQSEVNPHRPRGSKLPFAGNYLLYHLIRKVIWTFDKEGQGLAELSFQEMINMGLADEDGVITSASQVCEKTHMHEAIPGNALRWSCDACCIKPAVDKFGAEQLLEAIKEHHEELSEIIHEYRKNHLGFNPSYYHTFNTFFQVRGWPRNEPRPHIRTKAMGTPIQGKASPRTGPKVTQPNPRWRANFDRKSGASTTQGEAAPAAKKPRLPVVSEEGESPSLVISFTPATGTPVISQVDTAHTVRFLEYHADKEMREAAGAEEDDNEEGEEEEEADSDEPALGEDKVSEEEEEPSSQCKEINDLMDISVTESGGETSVSNAEESSSSIDLEEFEEEDSYQTDMFAAVPLPFGSMDTHARSLFLHPSLVFNF